MAYASAQSYFREWTIRAYWAVEAEKRDADARKKVEAETKQIIEMQRQQLVAAQLMDFVGVDPLAKLIAGMTEECEFE